MSREVIEDVTQLLTKEPSFWNWLQYFSVLTWNKIRFAQAHSRVELHEPTITQNLVFDFWMLKNIHNWPVRVFEARDEKTNGNDLEFVIHTPSGYIKIPAQAKIVKENGKYPAINHKGKAGYQIDSLIGYAQKVGGIPMYLFYNYTNDNQLIYEIEEKMECSIEYFGCSIADANAIKKQFYTSKGGNWEIPTFSSLHPEHVMPFSYLGHPNLFEWYRYEHILQNNSTFKIYNEAEIIDDLAWKDLTRGGAAISGITTENETETAPAYQDNTQHEGFNPRFRIVFPYEGRPNQLVMMY